MKKLLIFILAMTVVLSLASCNPFNQTETEHTVHIDDNGDGLCDGCGGIMIDDSQPTVVGTMLKESIEKQFSETKSFKFQLEISTIKEGDWWYYNEYYDEELGQYVDDVIYSNSSYRNENLTLLDMWVSFNNDSVCAKLTATVGNRYKGDDSMEFIEPRIIYIMDGYAYSSLDGDYYKKEAIVSEELVQALKNLSDIGQFSEEEKDEFLNKLGVEVATVFNIKDNKGSYSFDAKPTIDKLVDYLNGLNMDSDTPSKVLDDVLKQISPDLTTEKIVEKLKSLADYSVNEALDELDKWLTENYDTTIQGIYDSLFTDPDLAPVVEMCIAVMGYLDVNNPSDKERLDNIIAQFKAVNFRQVIDEQGFSDLTLYEVLAQIGGFGSHDPETNEYVYMSKEEFFDILNDILNMSLAEFDEGLGTEIFTHLKKLASGVKINQLNAKIDLNFEGMLSLVSIDSNVNIDVEFNLTSAVTGKRDYERYVIKASLNLSEISPDEIVFSLPKRAKILESKLYTSDNASMNVNYYGGSDGNINARFYFTVYDAEGNEYRFSTYCNYNKSGNGYTSSVNHFYLNDQSYNVDDDIKFAFDPELETFTIIKLPDWNLAGGTFYSGSDRAYISYTKNSSDIRAQFSIYLYDEFGNEIWISQSMYINEASNTYTLDVNYFYYNDVYMRFNYSNSRDLTIVLDRETMTFTITEMPDWSLAY